MEKDLGMSIASMLDSSDLEYPPAYLTCALMYFTGTGITRNTETASEFASKYLLFSPNGKYSKAANEIISGSLGTQNATKLLMDLSKEITQASKFGPEAMGSTGTVSSQGTGHKVSKSNIKLIAGAGVGVVVLVGAALAFLLPSAGGDLMLAPPQSFDVKNVFTEDELKQSRTKALEEAGIIRTQARTKAAASK